MEENRDLLQAVLEDPDADAPRLVYADWLEEQGDPRAELIRLQCQLAGLSAEDPARPQLAQREETLLARYQNAVLGGLRPLVSGHEIRRGFIDCLTMEARVFLKYAEQLFHLVPLRRVRLIGSGDAIADLAECRFLGRLTALHLSANYIADLGVQALASSPYIADLTTLYLGHNRIGDDGVTALAFSPHVAKVVQLDLSHNRIRDRGAKALADSPYLPQLTSLNLSFNNIHDPGAKALAESHFLDRLTRLDLSAKQAALTAFSQGNDINVEHRHALKARFGVNSCFF